MGGGGVPRGRRPPSHIAYYVALAGILVLLVLLCCYFCYFFIKRVKELSQQDFSPTTPTAPRLPKPTPPYPVQPDVRETATAMAKLCKQLPTTGKGDSVFPTSTSPEAMRTGGSPPAPALQPALAPDTTITITEKMPTNVTNTECSVVEVAAQ